MKNGYFRVNINNKWMYEHRHIMEQIIGRPLTNNEAVHHIDKNRKNNSPKNLALVAKREHDRHETLERWKNRTFIRKPCPLVRADITCDQVLLLLNKNLSINKISKILKTTHRTIKKRVELASNL